MAIVSSDSMLLSHNLLDDNLATSGGGVYCTGSNSLALQANIFRQNVASDMPIIDEGYGGGIFAENCDIESANSVIMGNTAEISAMGTGIHISNSTWSLQHPTITGIDSEGTAVFIADALSTLTITNGIVVTHAVGIDASAGGTAVIQNVLWYANGQNTVGGVTVSDEMTADPQFAPDGYHLTLTSPAINAATPSDLTKDIDGGERPSCPSLPDLGADERHCIYIPIVQSQSEGD